MNIEVLDRGKWPHECRLPGTIGRVIRRLKRDAVVRCMTCGQKWQYQYRSSIVAGNWYDWYMIEQL